MVAMVGLRLLSGRANRSLDGGPWPRGAIGPQPPGPQRSGGRWQPAFFPREECRCLAAEEKSRRSRCGKVIEARSPGLIRPFEVAYDAPINGLRDHHECCHRAGTKDIAIPIVQRPTPAQKAKAPPKGKP